MPSVCIYFQVHQPFRLRRYSVFDSAPEYFDLPGNAEICRKVVRKSYLPANACLYDLIRRHEGRFRVSFSLTGVLLEQLEAWAPEAIESFQRLASTGCVEFLAESYHHSLAFMYSREEFVEQVRLQQDKIERLFGKRSTSFRYTELIYSNELAAVAENLGYRVVLAEGADQILGTRSPNFVYGAKSASVKLLLRNYRLSDDIAFRFSNRNWADWPLDAKKFAGWINEVDGDGAVVNLFMDYETLGEHQWKETGIFDFLSNLPSELFRRDENDFKTPSEVAAACEPADEFDSPHLISWADVERDLSAWLGNAMQSSALQELYKLESAVKERGDAALLADWRKLQSSDHFYYMCTKSFSDGDAHTYFNPYESPYDSYINFMNVLDNLAARARG